MAPVPLAQPTIPGILNDNYANNKNDIEDVFNMKFNGLPKGPQSSVTTMLPQACGSIG